MENKEQILSLLDRKHNVILMGAPGTGKSRLINEVSEAFLSNTGQITMPSHNVGAAVPIPATKKSGMEMSFLKKANRKVFRTTLHQNSKYRDFLTGIIPSVSTAGGFQISEGILYRANEFAKQENSAALLIIDELNRGPAVEVFGGSIVAIENDKRLSEDNEVLPTTQTFEIVNPVDGKMVEYAFSPNLYILSAMNQADVSVAPLDVAFLRRWQPYKLRPNYEVVAKKYGVNLSQDTPDIPATSQDVIGVATRALREINKKITIGRGEDYQLGHGVFLTSEPKDNTVDAALEFVLETWSMIYSHIEELFFGDVESIAFIVGANKDSSPYETIEANFAGEMKIILSSKEINKDNIYKLYAAIEEKD